MQLVPVLGGEELLEVALGLHDVAIVREAPARGEPVDVRVDREGGDTEGLRHDDAGGLVSDAGEGLELVHIGRNNSAVLVDQELRELGDRF